VLEYVDRLVDLSAVDEQEPEQRQDADVIGRDRECLTIQSGRSGQLAALGMASSFLDDLVDRT
jgi:hypothetical protein